MTRVRVDHTLYAVGDLEAASGRFVEEFGLASIEGGRHSGWGTANRIVPLGEAYLELISVVDPEEAASSVIGRPVLEAIATGDQLLGWAVATTDLESIADRLRLEVVQGSRARPDGATISWRLAGVEKSLATGGAFPFFIQWDGSEELHPGRAQVAHHRSPRGIAWIEVAAKEQSMRDWLGDVDFDLRVAAGPERLSAVAISTDAGEVVLR